MGAPCQETAGVDKALHKATESEGFEGLAKHGSPIFLTSPVDLAALVFC